ALFEGADLPADRRLAKVEGLPGMREAARLGDSVKHPQLVPIHRHLDCLREPRCSPRRSAYSAARTAAASSSAARNFSASRAAMQPMPAAVTAWRYTLSRTSPAAHTPGIDVAVESRSVTTSHAASIGSCPATRPVTGVWPIATKTPSQARSVTAPVRR